MTDRPAALDPEDPNLLKASARLQRIQWVWAALFAGMGLLTWFSLGSRFPLSSLPWFTVAVLLAFTLQPPALAMAAVLWALSLISVIPGFALIFGPDPISQVFSGGTVEQIGRAGVRIVLAIAAWNQFMLYRMLYGTESASGLSENVPDIPEMIPNHTVWFSRGALVSGILALLFSLAAGLPLSSRVTLLFVQGGLNLALLTIGAGLGTAFSPTRHRRTALFGLVFGIIAFLSAMAVGRLLLN
ncbi:MAG: hypothetical protein ACLFWD_11040 [Anaerolineales bacterium]